MELASDAVQSRPHGADRDVEDLGAGGVWHAFPRHEEQQIAIGRWKVGDGMHHRRRLMVGVEAVGYVEERVGGTPLTSSGAPPCAQSALLGPPMAPHQIGGDAEQPCSLRASVGVESVSTEDRRLEHVGDQVTREIPAESTREVAVHGVDVIVVQAGDRLPVHIPLLPERDRGFIAGAPASTRTTCHEAPIGAATKRRR